MARALLTLLMAGVSGGYWLLFLLLAEGVTASDYGPGPQPGAGALRLKAAAVLVAGPLLFAALLAGWRRLDRRLFG